MFHPNGIADNLGGTDHMSVEMKRRFSEELRAAINPMLGSRRRQSVAKVTEDPGRTGIGTDERTRVRLT